MDINRMNRIKREFDKANNPPPPPLEPVFNCVKNGDDFNPLYHPRTYPRAWLSCHISDQAMRNILHLALVDMGLENISDEELCNFMVENNIWDESQASAWVLNYIANKEVNNNGV